MIRPPQRPSSLPAMPDRRAEVVADVLVGLLELAHAERAARVAESAAGRSVAVTAVWVPSAWRTPIWTVCPAWPLSACWTLRPPNRSNRSPVDREDLVADGEPGGRAGDAGSIWPIADAEHRRRQERDQEEDGRTPATMFIATPATRIARRTRSDLAAKERGSSARVAVLALEPHEAADRQPVERPQRLALRAQDLGARREADAELEDADAERLRRSGSGRARGRARCRRGPR